MCCVPCRYLAVFRALEADDKDRVHMLFQCALTVTICAYAGISVENPAVESIKMKAVSYIHLTLPTLHSL